MLDFKFDGSAIDNLRQHLFTFHAMRMGIDARHTPIGECNCPAAKTWRETASANIDLRTDWENMVKEVGALIQRLQAKPVKLAYSFTPGSILNAYREGDLSFNEAVERLEQWKGSKYNT